jgi:hypothetical protein
MVGVGVVVVEEELMVVCVTGQRCEHSFAGPPRVGLIW